MKNIIRRQATSTYLTTILASVLLFIPTIDALSQSKVWISNPTQYPINYKLSFARSAQNFVIPPGRRNEHSSHEYPATFLVDLNTSLSAGYPQVKRFRLVPGRNYYFQLSNKQLHLLKQPATSYPSQVGAQVTAKVLVYSLGGAQPIYHSSIILNNTTDPSINGREWSFWPNGRGVMSNVGYIAGGRVVNSRPSGSGVPIKVFDLSCQQQPQSAASIFHTVLNRWNQMPYRPLDSNCNHFVNDMMVSLGLGRHQGKYLNSWGANVPLAQVQSAFENHYGVPCEHSGHGHAQPHTNGHNHQVPHGYNQPYPSRRIDPRQEILRRVLGRIFD